MLDKVHHCNERLDIRDTPEQKQGPLKVDYRADIDGLRAIAVTLVVFHHADVPGFSGGFVGVDIFFVISGFLITRLVLHELSLSSFSFLDFYARRICRLLPALTVVLLFSLLVGYFLTSPSDYIALAQSVISTSAFVSNIWFWNGHGYFAPQAHEVPLLHTWSLAVEEQFYLFWPLLLLFFSSRLRALIIVSGIMFVSSVIATFEAPRSAFFLAPFRVWELMLGALLVWIPTSQIRAVRIVVLAFGVVMISLSTFLLDSNSSFPGVNALFPVAGAAAVIWAHAKGFISCRPLVYIGKISYSWYLWHWPVLVFPSLWLLRPMTAFETAGAVVLSFVVAAVSTRYIERPFRRNRKNRAAVIRRGTIVILSTILAAWVIIRLDGLPQRFDEQALKALKVMDAPFAGGPCRNLPLGQLHQSDQPQCLLGTGPLRAILWGDSNAAHYAPMFDKLDFTTRQLTRGGCPPILGYQRVGEIKDGLYCSSFIQEAWDIIRNSSDGTLVVISAAWWGYTHCGGDCLIPSSHLEPNNIDVWNRGLQMTVEAIRDEGMIPVIIGPTLVHQSNPMYCLLYNNDCDVALSSFDATNQTESYKWLKAGGAIMFEPLRYLCPNEICLAMITGEPVYWDQNHLTRSAAEYLVPEFLRFLMVHGLE